MRPRRFCTVAVYSAGEYLPTVCCHVVRSPSGRAGSTRSPACTFFGALFLQGTPPEGPTRNFAKSQGPPCKIARSPSPPLFSLPRPRRRRGRRRLAPPLYLSPSKSRPTTGSAVSAFPSSPIAACQHAAEAPESTPPGTLPSAASAARRRRTASGAAAHACPAPLRVHRAHRSVTERGAAPPPCPSPWSPLWTALPHGDVTPTSS